MLTNLTLYITVAVTCVSALSFAQTAFAPAARRRSLRRFGVSTGLLAAVGFYATLTMAGLLTR